MRLIRFFFYISDLFERAAFYLQSRHRAHEEAYARALIDQAYPVKPPQKRPLVTYLHRLRR